MNEIKKNNLILSRESTNLLIEKCHNDRNNLRNELEKIKSFLAKGKKIEYDQIKYLVNSSTEIKNENLVNICLSGVILELKKILQELSIESINQILLLKILSNKIRRLLTIKNQNDTHQNLDSLINLSHEMDIAVGIAHVKPMTLQVLKTEIPKLEKEGYEFIRLSKAVK